MFNNSTIIVIILQCTIVCIIGMNHILKYKTFIIIISIKNTRM